MNEDSFLSSPEQDVSNVIFSLYSTYRSDGTEKIWAIARDDRGVHTWFTEPDGVRLIYYFKSLVDCFDDSLFKAEKYRLKKQSEKIRKGYENKGNALFLSSSRTFQIVNN